MIKDFVDLGDLTGKTVRIFSDPHFGHNNIIKYTGRPVNCDSRMKDHLTATTSEMYRVDMLICGGDFGFFKSDEQAQEFFDSMPARDNRILILGNHDERNKYVKRLPWNMIVRSIGFRYEGLSFAFKHRPFHQTSNRTSMKRWLLQRSTELLFNNAEKEVKEQMGSFFLDTQNDIPAMCEVVIHGHIHELGQRFSWIDNTLVVNACVEHWDYRTFNLDELVYEYVARQEYESNFKGKK